MMGIHQPQGELFSYQVNLEKRVRPDHPLRRVLEVVDFSFVRQEVAEYYGRNGHESVDPVILLKLMFLLFWDNVASERELMGVVRERLDYLWFLGYGLDEEVPNHSVLSKARQRWGREVFERLFVRTVEQCVAAGLVSGDKLHVDASLIAAHASKDAVLKSSPELIAACKAAYAVAEEKLEERPRSRPNYQAVNERAVSPTDPDAGLARKGRGESRPSYHHHRAVDDAHGVITAVITTSGAVPENHKFVEGVEQHQANTGQTVRTAVADRKYGTAENFLACQERGIVPHLADAKAKQATSRNGRFREKDFRYDPAQDTYTCPAGQLLHRRRYVKKQRAWEYSPARGVCGTCALRDQCTRSRVGRVVSRPEHQELLNQCRQAAGSRAARADRRRRQYLIEGSFADAANNHGFKRARWRRLWRQQIQDHLIAAIQNVRLLLARTRRRPAQSMARALRVPAALRSVQAPAFWRNWLPGGLLGPPPWGPCRFLTGSPLLPRSFFPARYGAFPGLNQPFWATRPYDAPK